ncbi:MAG TPA: Bax inhibitor-1/YccA family protein, partial [Phototrophicaceae bacterium]|nr:Bax inhibitor-1/YccA family protein [Phototrophicaceae bacterium]
MFNSDMQQNPWAVATPRVEIRPLMRLVYMWMTVGLLTTALIAMLVSGNEALLAIVTNPVVLFGSFIGQIGLVIALNAGMRRMSADLAGVLFFVYAALNGFIFSLLFVVYDLGSIGMAFLTTAGLFGAMTIVGYTTKTDLTRYSSYFMMGLIGLVIAMVVNMFLGSGPLDFAISIFGVLLFTGLTAYDTQKIKEMAADPNIEASGSLAAKLGILGALQLYLDFINLFL